MLNASTLGQLKDLKKQISDATPRIEGIVKGTKKRFGFVINPEDKMEYILPQEEMEKVLPGDSVHCILEAGRNPDEKPIARIEQFVNSDFSTFIGLVKAKNNNLFIIPDHPQFNRWVFIPPKARKGLSDGDMVSAKITMHPYKNKGRIQAEVTYLIGKPDDPFIEHRFAIAKHQIPEKIWQPDELEAIRMTGEKIIEESAGKRKDLTAELYVTIDGNSTQDLDDALSVNKTDNGWKLSVAIADVGEFVEENSPLDRIAQKQMSSIYLPGQKVPMLPDVLSSNLCSLREGERRLALICHINIDSNGHIGDIDFEEGIIASKAKLNYDDVAHFLDNGNSDYPDDIQALLTQLSELAKARKIWRKTQAIPPEDYPDYRLQLNERGKITSIERTERNSAQQLVEECMLSCNQATANFLAQNAEQALFIGSAGFKDAQMPGVKKLLNEYFPDIEHETLNNVEAYSALYRNSTATESELKFHEILKKKLHRNEWTTEKTSHFGLGFEHYTTFTSPIRKYGDLLIHRMIKRSLEGKNIKPMKDALLGQLNELNNAVRGAQRDCEMNLKCQYLEQHKGQSFNGEITMVNHRVIGVYLRDFDVHGMLEVRSLNEEYTFKQESLQLVTPTRSFKLGQKIDVVIDHIDHIQRQIKLKIVEPTAEETISE